MPRLVLILLVALFFEAIGVVLLSKGLKEIGSVGQVTVKNVASLVGRGVTNPNILSGIFFEALFFIGLLVLMSKADVSLVWPLTSLSFVFTTVAAKFFLHEHVSLSRWSGVFMIMVGAALITWSEKSKKATPATAQPVAVVVKEGKGELD